MTFNEERLVALHKPVMLAFTPGKKKSEIDALDQLKALSPTERTKFLSIRYEIWFNDQQEELARVGGE